MCDAKRVWRQSLRLDVQAEQLNSDQEPWLLRYMRGMVLGSRELACSAGSTFDNRGRGLQALKVQTARQKPDMRVA